MFRFFRNFKTKIRTLIELISKFNNQFSEIRNQLSIQNDTQRAIIATMRHLGEQQQQIAAAGNVLLPAGIERLNKNLHRNFLPNDDSALQKTLVAAWKSLGTPVLTARDLRESGFRVYSQNDEDGILLRIFSHIGTTNKFVIEIGSNCDGSDIGIPENLSTNLIVNHGWHGAVFEINQIECQRIRYFFSRHFSTKHFHITLGDHTEYYSPLVIQGEITPSNINEIVQKLHMEADPDLMVIDIDGGDYAVVRDLRAIRPRVLVVEFEKRFRDRHTVVQFDRKNFSLKWAQSGAASLNAWEKLLHEKGYSLCCIAHCGFNAFFVRSDLIHGKFSIVSTSDIFADHSIFSRMPESFWIMPDETWEIV